MAAPRVTSSRSHSAKHSTILLRTLSLKARTRRHSEHEGLGCDNPSRAQGFGELFSPYLAPFSAEMVMRVVKQTILEYPVFGLCERPSGRHTSCHALGGIAVTGPVAGCHARIDDDQFGTLNLKLDRASSDRSKGTLIQRPSDRLERGGKQLWIVRQFQMRHRIAS